MLSVNFKNALYSDVFKFVVGDKNDLIEMARILKEYPTLAKIYVSPVFGKIEPQEIVDDTPYVDDIDAEMATTIDDTDATLAQLASEFAETEDKIVDLGKERTIFIEEIL